MKTIKSLSTFLLSAAGLGLATGCVHTPPGTSVNVALAKRAALVNPVTPPPLLNPLPGAMAGAPAANKPLNLAASAPDKTELVADAFSRGDFCMSAGKDQEAIVAYKEAVKIDPNFAEAWTKLASLYEKTGEAKLAIDAYKRSKSVNTSASTSPGQAAL